MRLELGVLRKRGVQVGATPRVRATAASPVRRQQICAGVDAPSRAFRSQSRRNFARGATRPRCSRAPPHARSWRRLGGARHAPEPIRRQHRAARTSVFDARMGAHTAPPTASSQSAREARRRRRRPGTPSRLPRVNRLPGDEVALFEQRDQLLRDRRGRSATSWSNSARDGLHLQRRLEHVQLLGRQLAQLAPSAAAARRSATTARAASRRRPGTRRAGACPPSAAPRSTPPSPPAPPTRPAARARTSPASSPASASAPCAGRC